MTFTTHAVGGQASPGADACANAAVRTLQDAQALGECRAYEQISPVEKRGNPVNPLAPFRSAGETVVYPSNGAFAGAQASVDSGAYLARRSNEGWATTPLEAPQSNTQNQIIRPSLEFTSDLSGVVQFSRAGLAPGAFADGANLYARDNATGARMFLGGIPNGEPARTMTNDLVPATARYPVGVSSDLTHVTVRTNAPLTPDAPPGTNIYEAVGGQLRIVNRAPDGTVLAGSGYGQSGFVNREPRPLSADGRRAFSRVHRNPESGTNAGVVYMRVDGETTVPLSVSHRPVDAGTPYAGDLHGASVDGRYVYFSSGALLTPERSRGRWRRHPVPLRHAGRHADEPRSCAERHIRFAVSVCNVSADGLSVLFSSGEVLADGAVNGNRIGTCSTSKASTSPLRSRPQRRTTGTGFSDNGRYFAFGTFAPLTGVDNRDPRCPATTAVGNPDGVCMQVYVFDAKTDQLTCVSCDPVDGRPGQAVVVTGTNDRSRWALDDGRVLFTSAARLVSRDVNETLDVYSWEDGEVSLISDGRGSNGATFAQASEDGRNVYFTTTDKVVAQDNDNLTDLYVARVGGGLATQSTRATPSTCAADACQGSPTPRPDALTPGSDRASGPSAPTARPRATFSGGVPTARQRAVLAAGGAVTVKVKVNRAGRVAVVGKARVGRSVRTVLSASRVASKPGTVALRLKLSAAGTAELRKDRKLRITLSVAFAGARDRTATLQLTSTTAKRRAAAATTRKGW